jgi:Rrf2 family nitric oxide-sensitive transcriptional repressor
VLSQTVEYALRAMIVLAADRQARTVQDIARESRIPVDYLAKILRSLARAGLVTGQRGRGGGFQVAREAGSITVLDVVDAVDPLRPIEVCPLGLSAHERELCPLHKKLDEAIRQTRDAFAAATLESLVQDQITFDERQTIHVLA